MPFFVKMLLICVLCGFASENRALAQPLCTDLFSATSDSPFIQYPNDLSTHYAMDVLNKSRSEIREANRNVLETLQGFKPRSSRNKARAIPLADLKVLLKLMKQSPVVGTEALPLYSQKDTEIGYCFGRAAYAHLMLLKLGLQKESMMKIWAVGPLKTDLKDVIWDYHVALVAYTRELGWVTIDINEIKPEPVRHWVQYYQERSLDGRVRFYVTGAEKFNFQLGKYDRVQMGLNLQKTQDWFRGYFPDMLNEIRNLSLEKLGLRKLIKETTEELEEPQTPPDKKRNAGFLQTLKEQFWP